MARKPKNPATPKSEKFPRKSIPCVAGKTDEETGARYARLLTSPELAALRAIFASEGVKNLGEHIDAPTLVDALREQSAAVNCGDIKRTEAMLMSQATALQTLFARLTERAMDNDTIPAFEANMRMALRAQSQCRATLETLATIKNPPIVYARQANVTSGPQQINNGMLASSQAGEIENQPNKLLEAQHGNYVDTGTARAASGADSELATVGEIDRAEVAGRQSDGFSEC